MTVWLTSLCSKVFLFIPLSSRAPLQRLLNICDQDYRPTTACDLSRNVIANDLVTCEIELSQNCFSLRRRPTEINSFQRMETSVKLFQKLVAAREYFSTCSMSLK